MPSESSAWRHGLWVAGLVGAVWVACFQFPSVWVTTGIGESTRPFLDLHAILAACDAVRAGVNPFLPNEFDPYHRPHVYSEWWFGLGRLGLTREDTHWVGGLLLGIFLVTAVAIVSPRTWREGVGLFLVLVSPVILMAVNRANNDLVVFVVISGGLACFRSRRWPVQALGVVLLATAAVLKYYPLVTLVVLLDLSTRRGLLAALGLYALVLVLAYPGLTAGLESAARYNPAPDGLFAFGAPVLLRNLGITSPIGWLVPAGLVAAVAAWAVWGQVPVTAVEPTGTSRTAEREFMCGAALVVALFFLGSSYVYKLIFALWLLPWLGQRGGGSGAALRWRQVTLALLLAVVWLEGGMAVVLNLLVGPWSRSVALGLVNATLVAAQLCTWALVVCLLRYLLVYLARRGRALWGHA